MSAATPDQPRTECPRKLLSLLLATCLAIALSGTAIPVQAAPATIWVDTGIDSNDPAYGVCDNNPVNDNCSLRGAISKANAGGLYIIELPARPYTLSETGPHEDANVYGDLDVNISSALVIHGADEATTIIDAGDIDRVLENHGNAPLTIQNVTLRNGTVGTGGGGGGGIRNRSGSELILDNVIIEDNMVEGTAGDADSGGGLRIYAADASLSRVIIRNNHACNGGGIFLEAEPATLYMEDASVAGNGARCDFGGGFYMKDLISADIRRATFSTNEADNGGGVAVHTESTLQMINVTIANNTATNGGGFYAWNNLAANLNHVTISGNIATTGRAVYLDWSGQYEVASSILTSGDIGNTCFRQSVTGTTSNGYNILREDTTCFSSYDGTDIVAYPGLGSLGNYGGFTKTIPLLAGSPAIDGVLGLDFITNDQRQWGRVDGDGDGIIRFDIGAYEYPSIDWLPLILK